MTQTLMAIAPQKILLVDDVPANLDVLLEHLKDLSCILRVATSGEDALRLAAEDPPDLILLDIMMPGMDGYEVLRRLKENRNTRSIAVIFVTAVSDSLDEARGLDIGAVDYIAKPFVVPVLKARVKNHLELKRKTDLLEELALADGLTGIANRRHFERELKQEWQRSERHQHSLSLLMIDVDHFKQFNDHYGHGSGDDCLRRVAKALAGCVQRPGDLVARYGGEEFVALLPNMSAEQARSVAEIMCRSVRELAIEHQYSSCLDLVSISVGSCTALPSANVTSLDFLRRADTALYQAKTNGRNRVCEIN
jgi:diguanylate cyclase (GGDEF)-like protein